MILGTETNLAAAELRRLHIVSWGSDMICLAIKMLFRKWCHCIIFPAECGLWWSALQTNEPSSRTTGCQCADTQTHLPVSFLTNLHLHVIITEENSWDKYWTLAQETFRCSKQLLEAARSGCSDGCLCGTLSRQIVTNRFKVTSSSFTYFSY